MMQDDVREDQYSSTWDKRPSDDEEDIADVNDPSPKPVDIEQQKYNLIAELGKPMFQEMYDTVSQVGAGFLHGASPEDYYGFFDISEILLAKYLPNIIQIVKLENS